MAAGRNHVLPSAKINLPIRCFQLVTAVAILALASINLGWWSFSGVDLILFSAVKSIIIAIYAITADSCAPAAYNYWAMLSLDIIAILFWIGSSTLLGINISNGEGWTYYSYYKHKRGIDLLKREWYYSYDDENILIAAASLGGVEFLLFLTTLIITSVYLHRHREAGGHSEPSSNLQSTFPLLPQTSQGYQPVPVQQAQQQALYQPAPVQHQQNVYQSAPIQPQQQIYQQQPPQPVYKYQ